MWLIETDPKHGYAIHKRPPLVEVIGSKDATFGHVPRRGPMPSKDGVRRIQEEARRRSEEAEARRAAERDRQRQEQ